MTSPIVSVNIMGGLGNQLFQIASAYAYARKERGTLQIICRTATGNRPSYWTTLLERVVPYHVSSLPSTLTQWREDVATQYKEISPLPLEGLFLNGYFQSSKYFYNDEMKDEIKQLVRPSPSLLESVSTKYKHLLDHKDRVVVLHARRTDYLQLAAIHGPLEGAYYKKALQTIMGLVENPIFLLCGDDMSFWKEIKDDIPAVYTHEHHSLENESDINTFALLQQFNTVIMSNSSFIWWTTWMADAKNVIAPAKWFGPAGPKFYEDIYESHWIRL